MLSERKVKYYSSLKIKKYRQAEKKFTVEGLRLVDELLKSNYPLEIIIFTEKFQKKQKGFVQTVVNSGFACEIIKPKALRKICDTENPQGVAAIALYPSEEKINIEKENVIVALDDVSEPGNAGTILRTCDWFGIKTVLLSKDSVDPFNPKVVRASMGAIFNLNIIQSDLADELIELKRKGFVIFATAMSGTNIFGFNTLPDKYVLIFSNEAHGISDKISVLANEFLMIPQFGKVESLNVASAAAIVLAELRRKDTIWFSES